MAEEPASDQARRLVVGIGLAYAVLAALVLPFATVPGPAMPGIAAAFAVTLIVTEGCTAFLLFAQVRTTRSTTELGIAGACLFSALMAALHLLTFPGALLPDAPVIGPAQAVGWLVLAWHIGFPAIVLATLAGHGRRPPLPEARVMPAIVGTAATVTGATVIVALLVVWLLEHLPAAHLPVQGARWSPVNIGASWLAVALSAAALVLLWVRTRGRTVLFLWLAMSLLAFAGNTLLGAAAGGRYTLAWYAGRASLMVSGGILLAVFLARFARQNRALSTALTRLSDQTDALRAEIARREAAESGLLRAQKLDALGQLTAGIAHDFNNLLSAVGGSLETLELRLGATARDAEVARMIATARGASARGARLTRDLMAFGRTQSLKLEPVDLDAVVRESDELVRHAAGPAIQIEHVRESKPWPARADASQMQLVLLNLVLNARDAMPKGGTVVVATENVAAGDPRLPADLAAGDYLALTVTDTGTGMTPDVLAKCLDPFFTTKEVGKGSGIGLSMVHGVATQSGGALQITSEPGLGTSVRVLLPRSAEPPAPRAPAPAPVEQRVAPPPIPKIGAHVLLVDDDADVRSVVALQLSSLGCPVTVASSGAEAVSLLREHGVQAFDLLLTDYAMPGMTGTDLLQAARALRPDLPALLITGHADAKARAASAADGQLWLSKPFQRGDLASALRKVLGVAA